MTGEAEVRLFDAEASDEATADPTSEGFPAPATDTSHRPTHREPWTRAFAPSPGGQPAQPGTEMPAAWTTRHPSAATAPTPIAGAIPRAHDPAGTLPAAAAPPVTAAPAALAHTGPAPAARTAAAPPPAEPAQPPLDPQVLGQVTQAAGAMLPMIAAALAGLAQAGTANKGAANTGGTTIAASDGSATPSPDVERALKVLKSLAAQYGDGEPGSQSSDLRAGTNGSAGSGDTARMYRARQLYQRNVRKAFNNIDNRLVDSIAQLAGDNAVDRRAVLRIIRDVDVQLAELGPNAYTREGQRKVQQILTAALRKAQTIVHGGTTRSATVAESVRNLANLYVRDLAGMTTIAGNSSSIDRAIRIARGELGVREVGTNRVNRPYNINDRWCASFATWVWKNAGIDVRWSNKNFVPSIWSDARRMGVAASPASARPGDLIIFPGQSHVGLVVARNGNSVTTIEGNSGDAVRQRTHNLSSGFVGVVHPPK